MLISINWPSLVTSWVVVQKIYSKMHLVSCTNTHRSVTDLVNHGMVKNTLTRISGERNIIFLQNKKIPYLGLQWHIWRSYRFVAEVTFKKKPSHATVLNRQYQAGLNIKQNHLFYIVFQILKVYLVKSYNIYFPVLLFLVVLHQLIHQHIQFFINFSKLYSKLSRKRFSSRISFF